MFSKLNLQCILVQSKWRVQLNPLFPDFCVLWLKSSLMHWKVVLYEQMWELNLELFSHPISTCNNLSLVVLCGVGSNRREKVLTQWIRERCSSEGRLNNCEISEYITMLAKFFARRADSSVAWLGNYALIAAELCLTSPEDFATICFTFHLCSSQVNWRQGKIAQHMEEKWKRRNCRCNSERCSRHHLCIAESFVWGSIYPGSRSLSCQPLGIIIHPDRHIIKPGVSELMNNWICE